MESCRSYEVLHLSRKIILANWRSDAPKCNPCHAKCIFPDPLEMSHACHRFWKCYKALLWQGAEPRAPATQNHIWTFRGHVLRATSACAFSTSQLPKVLRCWCVLHILTSECASRHNGVQFFISHLARWLRTHRFIFFPLTLSLLWSSFFFSSLLWLFPRLLFHLSILSEVWLLNFLWSNTFSQNQEKSKEHERRTHHSSFIPDKFCQAWMGAKNHHIVSLLGSKRPTIYHAFKHVRCLTVPVLFNGHQKMITSSLVIPCVRVCASLPAQPVTTGVGMRVKTLPRSGKRWKTSLEGLQCWAMPGCSLIATSTFMSAPKLLTSEHRSAEFVEVVRAG